MPARKEPVGKAPAPKKRQYTKASGKGAASKATTAIPRKRKIKDDENTDVVATEGTLAPKKVATAKKQHSPTKPTQQYQAPPHFSNISMNARVPPTPEESPQEGRLASPNNLQPLGFPHSQQGQQHSHAAYASAVQSINDVIGRQNMSPQAQALHVQASSPRGPQAQRITQPGPQEHSLHGIPNNARGDIRRWLFRQAMNSQSNLKPDLHKLNFHITSDAIDDMAWVMWELAMNSTNNGGGDLLWRSAAFSANMSDLKLRTLASMNVLPAWWLFREHVVEQFRAQTGWTVDDSVKESLYDSCLQYALKQAFKRQEMQKRREQQEMENAMAMEREQGTAKVEQ